MVTLAKRENVGTVKAKWRDLAAAETQTVAAGGDDDGDPNPEGKSSSKTLRGTYASAAEATAAADGELRRRRRGRQTLGLSLAVGRPDLIAGQPLRVEGFRPEIDGVDWHIESITHRLDDRGLVTDIQAEEG